MDYDSEKETRDHVRQVAARLAAVCEELGRRGEAHDASKFGAHEKPLFDAVGARLQTLVYGTEDYEKALETLRPALTHHYANNSHHPEHYPKGIAGMDLVDLMEMYCDWAAAVLRTRDGSLPASIDINIQRFGIEPQLAQILHNTWTRYGGFCGQPEFNAPVDTGAEKADESA